MMISDSRWTSSAFFSSMFLVLLLGYGLKFAEVVSFDVVPIMWGLVLLSLILVSRFSGILWSLVFYFFISIPYVAAMAFGSGYGDGMEYVRTILISFLFTTVSLSVFIKDLRFNVLDPFGFLLKVFAKAGVIVVLGWSWFVFSEGRSGSDFSVADYGGANYLTISDLLALFSLSILSAGFLNKKWLLGCLLGSAVALILLGSRAAFVIYFVSVVFFVANGVSFWKKIFISILAFVFFFLVVFFVIEYFDSSLLFRFETIFDLSADESKAARSSYVDVFFNRLTVNSGCWLYPCMPDVGSYVHSIVSVHEYFGLVGTLLVFLLALNLILMLREGYKIPFLPVFFYSLSMVFFARAWVSITFSIVIAYLLAALMFRFKGGPKSLLR